MISSVGTSLSSLEQRLSVVLGAEGVVDDLRRYYGVGLPSGMAAFTGSRFEHLAGGGDRPEVADRFTAEGLVAVQTLSVTVPASVALDLLEGRLGARLSGLLQAIPWDIDMGDAEADILAEGSLSGPGLAPPLRPARSQLGHCWEASGA